MSSQNIYIYKQKGIKGEPTNYRPITLLSWMGKSFTCMINNRLHVQSFSESHHKITQCQEGFRKGFSTIEHNFALNTLINLVENKRISSFAVL